MKISYPSSYGVKIGAVTINALQKVYEIDLFNSQFNKNNKNNKFTRAFDNLHLSSILEKMAIIIPVKNEKPSLLEGVLSGIPNECLVIIVSNSERTPSSMMDRFSLEVEMVKQYSRFADKKIIIVHQKDIGLGSVFNKLGYNCILDSNERYVRDGKAEGMIIGVLLAKTQAKDYIGFIDSDNYFPGAVNEYVKIFASGFAMSNTPYSNIRILWNSKPKIINNQVKFPRFGRISESSNKYLNSLISHITGTDTDIIITANAGEHALSMSLAERLNYASGYSVEPYEFLNILEKFGGVSISPSLNSLSSFSPLPCSFSSDDVLRKGVEIFQIESRNPHFHEEKGGDHIKHMMEGSLLAIYNSKICNSNIELTKEIKNQLFLLKVGQNSYGNGDNSKSNISHRNNSNIGEPVSLTSSNKINTCRQKNKSIEIMEPIKSIPIDKFADLVTECSSIIKI